MFGLTGYICPRCRAKASDLPTDCAVCGLKLVLAPHLARSFHHLFPVPPFVEVPDDVSLKDVHLDLNKDASPEPIMSNDTTVLPNVTSSSKIKNILDLKKQESIIEGILVTDSISCDRCCYGCMKIIPRQKDEEDKNDEKINSMDKKTNKNGSGSISNKPATHEPSLRFQCPDCLNIFCADCDAYLHETLHNCPGCLCKG